MIISIPKEININESRIAIIPSTVKEYIKKGFSVQIESGAGNKSFISDKEFQLAGASITKNAQETLQNADLVLKKAKGKYFCWIGDDDWRSDVFIEKMVEDIEKLGHGYICFSDYKEVINDCQLSPSHRFKKSNFSFLRNGNRVIRLITFLDISTS